jgi:hypothetical protein
MRVDERQQSGIGVLHVWDRTLGHDKNVRERNHGERNERLSIPPFQGPPSLLGPHAAPAPRLIKDATAHVTTPIAVVPLQTAPGTVSLPQQRLFRPATDSA